MRHAVPHRHKKSVLARRNKKGLWPRKRRGIPQPYSNPSR